MTMRRCRRLQHHLSQKSLYNKKSTSKQLTQLKINQKHKQKVPQIKPKQPYQRSKKLEEGKGEIQPHPPAEYQALMELQPEKEQNWRRITQI